MKILALHDSDEIAKLLMDIAIITEADIVSVPNITKFREYLSKYQFNAILIFEKFFNEAIDLVLKNPKASKAICILVQNEESISKFLRLGVTEANVETIPFNPLLLLVKVRGLINAISVIKQLINSGNIKFDFYRYGLFNILNVLTETDQNLFLVVKDVEEDKILYSLRIRGGQVVSSSLELSKLIEINLDDSVPKLITSEPVTHEDREIFKDTADFYRALLKVEKESQEPVVVRKKKVTPHRDAIIKVNPLRSRFIYSFPYGGYILYSQPFEKLSNTSKAIFTVPLIDETILSALKFLKLKGGNFKLLTSPSIKTYLKLRGFEEKDFFKPKEEVKIFEMPHLGDRLEAVFFFPEEGILISGNLFGSYVSKDIPFFDKIFSSHLRVFHRANISCGEKLQEALKNLESVRPHTFYILPTYGYGIDITAVDTVFNILTDLDIPREYRTLELAWDDLKRLFPLETIESFDDFLKALEQQDSAVVYSLLDEMDVLNVVPYEF